MSDFDIAISILLPHEGGFVIDDGGPTNFGISLNKFLQPTFDKHPEFFAEHNFKFSKKITEQDVRNLTKEQAIIIYKHFFWDASHYDSIIYYPLKLKAFDLCVNMGIPQCSKLLQRACNSVCGHDILVDDGVIGKASLAAINACNGEEMYNAFISACEAFYNETIKRRPGLSKDKRGWLNRLHDRPKD